eukprot:3113619-Amphidinium_carterae.1
MFLNHIVDHVANIANNIGNDVVHDIELATAEERKASSFGVPPTSSGGTAASLDVPVMHAVPSRGTCSYS